MKNQIDEIKKEYADIQAQLNSPELSSNPQKMAELGKRQISSILVEGGSAIITSMLSEMLIDRLVIILAPKILGKGIDAVGNLGKRYMDEAIRLVYRKVYRKGEDIIILSLF